MKLSNLLLALLSGILLWLGWPTYGMPVLLFVAFVPLLIVEHRLRLSHVKRSSLKLFGLAYLSFFIWNFATTSWLYYASFFGMCFAVLVNSLLMTVVFYGYHKFAKRASQNTALVFLVCLWLGFEYLHLHWDFSWPWLNLGNGFSEYVNWIQWYEYTGTFGGSLWIWLVNIVAFKFVYKLDLKAYKLKIRLAIKSGILISLILIPIGLSHFILFTYLDFNKNAGHEVLIVQPNINPYTEKYTYTNNSVVTLITDLVKPHLSNDTRFIITPETVIADNVHLNRVAYNPSLSKLKRSFTNYPNTSYLGGISLIDTFSNPDKATVQSNLHSNGVTYINDYNSAMFFNQNSPIDFYHKSKLVVGIENFPYKGILQPILGDAMINLGGTTYTKTTQKERSVFMTKDSIKVAPIICYESVYGEYVTDYVKNGAQFLSIITNDAWWNNTQGHQQHLSLARLRSIETRRWIARSANTGISAIINHKGAIIKSLGYEKQGVLKGNIKLRNEITFYTQHGNYIARIALFIGAFTLLLGITKRRN